MKSALALALVVGVALCNSTAYYGWAPHKEYVYRFESQMLTGIPEIKASQYAGLKLVAEVKVQAFSDYTLRVQFKNPRLAEINRENLVQLDGRPEVPMPEQPLPAEIGHPLSQAFEARLKRGVVESLVVERDEPVVVTNIKKALLSQIQMDLSASRRVELKSNSLPMGGMESRDEEDRPKATSYFTTEERTVTGDCQTSYTIHPVPEYQANEIETRWINKEKKLREIGSLSGPKSHGKEACRGKQYYEITKTKNFDNCKERPVYQALSGVKAACDLSKSNCKNTMTHMSSTRFVVCGSPEEFYIREAVTDNEIIANPLGWNTAEKVLSTAKVSLFLMKVETSGYSPLPKPREPKEDRSLVYEYPAESQLSSKPSTRQVTDDLERGDDSFVPIMPKPDLHSASTFVPPYLSEHEMKDQIVQIMKKVIDVIFESPESCPDKTDVAGHILTMSQYLRTMSLSSLKNIESAIMEAIASDRRPSSVQTAKDIFEDILSIMGTNPAAALIKEKIDHGKLKGYKASHVLNNVIRNVRTPTKELLKELLMAVKATKEINGRQAFSSALLQLADLVYLACVDPSTSVSQFPVRIYGRFCHKDSSFIKEEFIPYLEKELMMENEGETERLAAITALGKLGEKKAFMTLVKAVEGKMGKSPMLRSVAVHSLKRLAQRAPATVRPILLALIDNPAENTQVRIAAVAILPWTQPSVAELQKIAIRSWFEPSKQVASFIHSTLVNLPHTEIPELKPVGVKAKSLASIVRPFQFGVQYSKNGHSDNYVPYSSTGVSSKFSYVSTAESIVPARLSFAAKNYFGLFEMEELTWTAYTQGMDKLIDKAIAALGMKSETTQHIEEALKRIDRQLNIKPRLSETPSAVVHTSSFGYEQFYTLDGKYYAQIAEKLAEEMRESARELSSPEGRRFNHTAASVAIFAEALSPMDTGFPIYVEMVIPVVTSVKGKVKIERSMNSEIPTGVKADLIALMNIKIQATTSILTPFSKKMIGSGVDIGLHTAAPGQIELQAAKEGQVTISLKVPEKDKKIELMHTYIKPFTYIKDVKQMEPMSKSTSAKKIMSGQPLNEFNTKIGQAIGIEAHLHTAFDYGNAPYATLYEHLSQHTPISAIIGGGLVGSVRYSVAKVTFNPSESVTKELKTRITFATGGSNPETERFEVTFPKSIMSHVEHEIELSCTEHYHSRGQIDECKRRQVRALEEISEEDIRICEELERRRPHESAAKELAEKELCRKTIKVCEQAKKICEESGRHAAEKCQEKKEECLARQSVLRHMRKVSETKRPHREIASYSPVSGVIVEASLRSKYGPDRSLKTVAVASNSRHGSNSKLFVNLMLTTPSKPAYEVELEAEAKVPPPQYRWNIQSLLEEPIHMEIIAKAQFGHENGEKEAIELESKFSKTESQKQSVEKSPEYRKCEQEESKGYKLASVCMEVRHEAASVNEMDMSLRFPPSWKETIVTSPVLSKLDALFKYTFLPNLSVREAYNSRMSNEMRVKAEFTRHGDECKAEINLPSGTLYKLKSLVVPRPFRGVMPLSLRNGVTARLIQTATRDQAPASCRIEPAYISTFDNKTYHYELNGCTHLLFKDCSGKEPVAVLAEGPDSARSGSKNVKIYAGSNEIVLKHGSHVEIEVNGEKKSVSPGEHFTKRSSSSGKVVLIIYRHKDNVVQVKSPVEGLEVLYNGERIEIVAPQLLHNRACGLCGDLNGENTADLKTPEECLMSKAKFNAYSYMFTQSSSGRCPGIPQEDRADYEHEKRQCVRSHSIPTPLEDLARSVYKRKPISAAHSIIMQENQICISKRRFKVCSGPQSHPEKVETVVAAYACLSRPSSKAQQFVERARAGEIVDELVALPTAFSRKQKEPVRCSGERPVPSYRRRQRQNYRNLPRY